MAAHFMALRKGFWSAGTMMAPYFSLVYEEMFSKYRPWIKYLDLIAP